MERAAIEQLKQEKAKYTELQQELLARKASSPAHVGQHVGQVAKLEQLASMYMVKAQNEQQLLSQIEQQLEHAKAQLGEHRKRKVTCSAQSASGAGGAATRAIIVFKDRLAHQKQRLDEAVARNKAVRDEIDDLSKQGVAAQQLYHKVQKQLADTTAEAARLQQQVAAVEEAQQQAAALTELLSLHNDAEQLSMGEAEKQVLCSMQQLQMQREQQCSSPSSRLACKDSDIRHAGGPQQTAGSNSKGICVTCTAAAAANEVLNGDQAVADVDIVGCGLPSITEEEAAATLERLYAVLSSAADGDIRQYSHGNSGAQPGVAWQAADSQQVAVAASSIDVAQQGSKQQWVVQRVQQLHESTGLLFKQCSIANLQLAQLQSKLLALKEQLAV